LGKFEHDTDIRTVGAPKIMGPWQLSISPIEYNGPGHNPKDHNLIKQCYLHGSLFLPFLVFCAQIPEGSLVGISPSPLERSSFAVKEKSQFTLVLLRSA
jgi:hypothetical protein